MRSSILVFLFACASGDPSAPSPSLDAASPDSPPDALAPDRFEANDDEAHATMLGDFDDSLDPFRSYEGLTIVGSDQDWFRFHVTDGLDFGNPWIVVATWGHVELAAWFACDTTDLGSQVACGPTVCLVHAQCEGTVDNGTITLRVQNGSAYDLYVGVE